MKKRLLIFLCTVLIIFSCKKESNVVAEKPISFDDESNKLLESIKPNILGSWVMKEVGIRPSPPHTNEIGIYSDVTLNDFATLDIVSVNTDTKFSRVSYEALGMLKFKNKNFPVGFNMLVNPSYIDKKKGAQVLAFVEFRFPFGVHTPEDQEVYLKNLSLVNNNYTIEISSNGKTMNWVGDPNKGVKSISLLKTN